MAGEPKKVGNVANLTMAGKGRKKGVPNKNTTMLKDALLEAATRAGNREGREGLVGYLEKQAIEQPTAFLPLLGKVLPLQLTGADGGAIQITKIELVGVAAR